MIKKWFPIALAIISGVAYRSIYPDTTLIEALIVSALGGAVGGIIGVFYERYLGKHEQHIIFWLDNLLFCLFYLIASSAVGAIVSYAILGYFVHELLQHIIMAIVTLSGTTYLTLRKITQKKKRIKLTQNN